MRNAMLRIVLILYLLSFPARSEKLTLGYINLAPHLYTNQQGIAVGPLADFLHHHIAPKMNVTFTFIHTPIIRIFNDMDKEKLSGIALAGYNEERANRFIYPKNKFSTMTSALALLKSHPLNKITSPNDINSLVIAYMKGAIATPYMKEHNIKFTYLYGVDVFRRNTELLLKGRIDAIYSPILLNMTSIIKHKGLEDIVKVIELPEKPIDIFTVFSNSKENRSKHIVERYNKAFEAVDGKKNY